MASWYYFYPPPSLICCICPWTWKSLCPALRGGKEEDSGWRTGGASGRWWGERPSEEGPFLFFTTLPRTRAVQKEDVLIWNKLELRGGENPQQYSTIVLKKKKKVPWWMLASLSYVQLLSVLSRENVLPLSVHDWPLIKLSLLLGSSQLPPPAPAARSQSPLRSSTHIRLLSGNPILPSASGVLGNSYTRW